MEKEYRLKHKIKAIQYDGTEKMALEIDNSCRHSNAKYSDDADFIGLLAFTHSGIRNNISEFVYYEDYLIKYDDFYILMRKEEFENKYEV